MLRGLLSSGFGRGGPAAIRQTGHIARTYYALGLGAAAVWLFLSYFVSIADHLSAAYSIFNEDFTPAEVTEKQQEAERSHAKTLKKLNAKHAAIKTERYIDRSALPKASRRVPNIPKTYAEAKRRATAWGNRVWPDCSEEETRKQILRDRFAEAAAVGESHTVFPQYERALNAAIACHERQTVREASDLWERRGEAIDPEASQPFLRYGVCRTVNAISVVCPQSYLDEIHQAPQKARDAAYRAAYTAAEGKAAQAKAEIEAQIAEEAQRHSQEREGFTDLLPDLQKRSAAFFVFGAGLVLAFWLLISSPRLGLVGGRSGRLSVFWLLFFSGTAAAAMAGDFPLAPPFWSSFWVFGVAGLMVVAPTGGMMALEALKEWDWWREKFILPKGPAARWGGILAFIRHDIGDFYPANSWRIAPQGQSTIYLGKTLAEQDPKLGGRHIGLRSETHQMTVALTGAGKSWSAIWNTLLSWSGGAFVFDPKGEHTQRTFKRRSAYRPAYALDPYRMTPHITETAHYNPVDEIDPASPTAGDDIMTLAQSSLFIEKAEAANTAHFRENAQKILKGFIAHVMTTAPAHQRHLPAVFDLIATGAIDAETYDITAMDAVFKAMRSNPACGKAPMFAMKILDDVSVKERGSYLSTIYRGIEWVNSGPVRRTLLKSDFKMSQLKSEEITVYLILPRRRIPQQSRWIRTLADMALFECEETPQPTGSRRKVLMILDEFAQLGVFRPIKDGLATVRSANIKLWVLFQNIGQIRELYDNAGDFSSSCDQQFFGVHQTDEETKAYISGALGTYLDKHKEGRAGQSHHQEQERKLLTPQAVAEFLKPNGDNQIVIPSGGGLPLKLTRIPFTQNCARGSYGDVQDLQPTIAQDHIDEAVDEINRPHREAAEAAEAEDRAKAREEAKRRAEQDGAARAQEQAEKRAFWDNVELEPKEGEEPQPETAGGGAEDFWDKFNVEFDGTLDPEILAKTKRGQAKEAGFVWVNGQKVPLEPQPELEEAGEVKASAQKKGKRGQADYTPEQEAARRRWHLPVLFTFGQLGERLPIMLEIAPANDVDRVMAEYEILKDCAVD